MLERNRTEQNAAPFNTADLLAQRIRTAAAALEAAFQRVPPAPADRSKADRSPLDDGHPAQRACELVFECAYRFAWAATTLRTGIAAPFDTDDYQRQKATHCTWQGAREWLQEGTRALAIAVEAFPPGRLSETLVNPFTGEETTWAKLADFCATSALQYVDQIHSLPAEAARVTGEAAVENAGRAAGEAAAGEDHTVASEDHTMAPQEEMHPEDLPAERGALGERLTALADRSSDLARRVQESAKAMEISGVFPDVALIEELAAARSDFDGLRANVLELAQSAGISALPSPEQLDSITALQPVLHTIKESEHKQEQAEQTRRNALTVLGRVLAIRHREAADFGPLLTCQAEAENLRRRIADAPWSGLPPDAEDLATREHPYLDLLTLVGSDSNVDDEEWALLQKTVEQTLGKPLSLAAARGKLMHSAPAAGDLAGDSGPQAEAATEQTPGSDQADAGKITSYQPLSPPTAPEHPAAPENPSPQDKKAKKGGFRFGGLTRS